MIRVESMPVANRPDSTRLKRLSSGCRELNDFAGFASKLNQLTK